MTDKQTDTAPTLKQEAPALKTQPSKAPAAADTSVAAKHDPPAPKATAKAAPEAPILPGYEGETGATYETVILTQGTIDQGAPFRIVKTPELPLSLAMGGARYLIANHAQKLYVWQVK